MSVQHHLDDATLLQYVSGELDEAFAIVVASHLAMCEDCRHAALAAEELGGAVLEDAEVAEMSAGSFEHMMLKLGGDMIEVAPRSAPGNTEVSGDVPLPLAHHIGHELSGVSWRTIAPGVRKHVIKPETPTHSSIYMLHIAPGTAVPEHGHGGAELTLILSGTYTDAMGAFSRGDIADLDEHIEHQPMVEGDMPCICLVATEAPTRFKDFFSRLLQPLTGI